MIAGISRHSSAFAARRRRSPAMSSNPSLPGRRRTVIGWSSPLALRLSCNSARSSPLNSRRGRKGLRVTCEIGIDFSAPSSLVASRVALPRSASRPRPRRRGVFSLATVISLRGSFDQFLGDIHVGLSPDRGNVVQYDRLPETWGFRKPDVPGDDAIEYLRAEIFARIVGNLPGKVQPGVVHSE